ncbi:MAG: preprotein translocase subunit YajC [Candidatus Omnitrophica bacterium]|nr:preprotein translocase subunit YajC [Candidatus Omnitrophota bacterium]
MPTGQTAANPMVQIVPFIAVFFIFYFLVIRPQNQRQKDLDKQRKSLQKNDEVITSSGIHGIVTLIKDRTIVLRVDENVKIEFEKDAIVSVVKK